MESLARELRRRVIGRPTLAALVGALAIAFSGIFYRLAGVSPSTGAFFRCAYALPLLWLLARRENAHLGPPERRTRPLTFGAGVFFAADVVLWHYSIEAVGAGLATVLANMQVVLVGLVAWAVFRERPAGRSLLAIPFAVAGIVLISGVLETGAYGENPGLGAVFGVLAGLAYTGFLLTLRHGSRDARRIAGPLFDVTLVAALATLPVGLAAGDLDVTPPLEATAWLATLALSSQVVGWLLISLSLPRLPAAVTSIVLTVQPVGSVVLAVLLLAETPSIVQLAGVVAIVAGVILATMRRREAVRPAPRAAGTA